MRSIRRRAPTLLWGVCLCVAAAVLVWRADGSDWLRSDVFELLPQSQRDALAARAVEAGERELSGRLLFLVGNAERSVAGEAADGLVEALERNAHIGRVVVYSGQRLEAYTDFYFPRRRRILTDEQVARIETRDGRGVAQAALAKIYSPISSVSGAALFEDPFMLFEESLRNLGSRGRTFELEGGYPWVSEEGVDYAFISARTVSATLDLAAQRQLVEAVEATAERLTVEHPGTRVLKTGFPFYAQAGAERARSEISIIGGGSLVGIALLMLVSFRSSRPLGLALLTIASGCLVALALTVGVFGSVHLFTLVFGASLIGVSIDYTFHYVSDELFGDADWTPASGLRRVLPGITLGLVTSVVAYLALTVAPFPGLRELAVFSSGGLLGAYVTLLCYSAWSERRLKRSGRPLLARLSGSYFAAWGRVSPAWRWCLAALVGGAALAGMLALEVNDDVSILQSRPAELEREEAEIARLLGTTLNNVFLLVRAESPQSLLEREEQLRDDLDELVADGRLEAYQSVSRHVPSAAKQRRSLDTYTSLVEARLPDLFDEIGMPEQRAREAEAALTRQATPFTVREWLAHPVSDELESLWVGTVEGATGSIVLLEGVEDVAALEVVAGRHAGVTIVDRARNVSELLSAYRVRVSWLLLAGYGVVLAMLALRYGLMRSAIVLAAPVLAGAAALSTIALLGLPVNLFNVLALILVLGIGIDYTLFIAESRHDILPTTFAITLAAATTILSFGLLALSDTFAIRSFGLTVLVGIACSYALAPLALSAQGRS